MPEQTNDAAPLFTTEEISRGMLRHAGRTYEVFALVGPCRMRGGFAVLVGAKGARYLMCDNGPRYACSAWNVSGKRNGWGGGFAHTTPFTRDRIAPAVIRACLGGADVDTEVTS